MGYAVKSAVMSLASGCMVAVALLSLATDPVLAAEKSIVPDFSGTWGRYPDPYAAFHETKFAEDPPAPGDGPTLKEPYAGEYKNLLQRRVEANKQGKPLTDASTQCKPEGMPTLLGGVYPIEILQTPRQLVMLPEYLAQTRRIYLNEKMPPLEDVSPSYNGYSVGHWEGETLVVQTIGVREDVQFYEIPHSAQMKLTERMKVTGPDLMEIQVTIDDPAFLARPYVFTIGYKRRIGYRIMEYICDNNRYHVDQHGNSTLEISSK